MLINDTCFITSIKATKEEIEKFKKLHMPIYFYDYPDAHYDEVGGFHDGPEGWNPNGMRCGECLKISCKGCENENK